MVDDDPQTLRYVRDTLDKAGYVPLVTGDPRELPKLVGTEKPQLVLLDLMLPGTDGVELMERVPELAELPVIFLSGYRRDETIARALELGAADYIVKPFSPTELTARVQAALRRNAGTFPERVVACAHYPADRRRLPCSKARDPCTWLPGSCPSTVRRGTRTVGTDHGRAETAELSTTGSPPRGRATAAAACWPDEWRPKNRRAPATGRSAGEPKPDRRGTASALR